MTCVACVLGTVQVQTLSVLWRHSMTCVACVLCTVQAYTLAQCTTHTAGVSCGQFGTVRLQFKLSTYIQETVGDK